jgi:hypothetical protein
MARSQRAKLKDLKVLMVKVLGSCIYLFEFVLVNVNVIVGAAGLKK